MLRRSKSIFHVGEQPDGSEPAEDAAATATSTVSSTGQPLLVTRRSHYRRAFHSDGAVKGLRIITHDIQAENSNVVNKASLKAAGDGRPAGGSRDFLKACCLCKKQLKPCKDVYMYMGDQGFCSRECRSRQISLDEGRECMEMAARRRSGAVHQRPLTTRNNVRDSDRYRRIPALAAYN